MKLNYTNTPLFYEISGKGDALILLHGFLESSSMWYELIPELSNKYKVISIDLPGHGGSKCIAETHSMELMAQAVRGVLQHLNITEAIFIGHSMGGYVALAYTELFEEEVSSLVLLNSTAAEDSPERKENRDRALTVIETNPKAFIRMAIANLFSASSQEKFASNIEQVTKEALQFPLEGIKAAITGMRDRKDRTLVFKHYRKNKYMIAAVQDPIVPFSVSEIWAKFCGAELIKVSEGHMSHIENKDEIVKILRFIE